LAEEFGHEGRADGAGCAGDEDAMAHDDVLAGVGVAGILIRSGKDRKP
jgi:hypothetical protein